MNDTIILFSGVFAAVLFLAGYFFTISEFDKLKDEGEERKQNRKTKVVD